LAALRVLALVVCDIRAAEAYCKAHTGQEGYMALLDMLINPGNGRPPLYDDACHLLAAQGAWACFGTARVWECSDVRERAAWHAQIACCHGGP
jgi:hypothetical protein